MKLIINADDFGLTDGVCRSIITLFENEAISNTTVMICVEGAFEQCQLLSNSGFADRVGVHLHSTPERNHSKPLSAPHEIPTLVDSSGNFKPKDHTDWINPKEIELEWERQIIKTSEALGRKPTHLDSHHGRHRIPELTPVYFKLAKKYGIPVRGGKSVHEIDGSSLGVKSSTLCDTDWTGQNKNLDNLKQIILDKISKVDDGILEIVSHPGFCDDELIASSSWNTVRENDHKVLMELAKEGWLQKNDIKLIQYSELS